jgi:hypothetical protein
MRFHMFIECSMNVKACRLLFPLNKNSQEKMKLEKVKKNYSSHVLKKRKNNDGLLNECL